VTKHFPPTDELRFFLTNPAPCPYLPGRRERKVFTSLRAFAPLPPSLGVFGPLPTQPQDRDGANLDPNSLHDVLSNAGFRRSQHIAYRPACDACSACVSVRIPVQRFEMTRRWRKVMARNADVRASLQPPIATEEQYWLLRAYLDGRHPKGGMTSMTLRDYAAMVEETAVRSHVIEYRLRSGPQAGDLIAAALMDVLGDALSLVYSFFDPGLPQRSLGVFTILHHVETASRAGLDYVHLGYWVRGSEKMAYKAQFRPLEALRGEVWEPLA
jgi:arginine-tRNA-protein transferase